MPNCKSVYDPREDSTMLEKHVRKHATGSVIDMGTGSGIQAITASYNESVTDILALDIQKEVVAYCKKNIKNRKISFLHSDLFDSVRKNKALKDKKFDTIIFNPPYLPQELKIRDHALEGGKHGYEVIERFLNEVNDFMKNEGIILLLFSSLTKKEKVDEFIAHNLFESELLETQSFFFEQLFVYKLKKSDLLRKISEKDVQDLQYFSKGKRGWIHTGIFNGKKTAIKSTNPKSKALSKIENEINMLKILNKKNIGPKLVFNGKDFFGYEFVEGIEILDWIEKTKTKKAIASMLEETFNQLYMMDQMNINKDEMSHPQHHILITKKNKPVLIDFERAKYTDNPGNVTQFCDFITSTGVKKLLATKNINLNKEKIIEAAKSYKKDKTKNNFNQIISLIS